MDRNERISLNHRLQQLAYARAQLNTKRGPLGHGVRVHADADVKRAAYDVEMAEIRAKLGR